MSGSIPQQGTAVPGALPQAVPPDSLGGQMPVQMGGGMGMGPNVQQFYARQKALLGPQGGQFGS